MTTLTLTTYTPPWVKGALAATHGQVREDYAAGVWSYAVGRPAVEHARYGEAVARAESGWWNPWWIRSWQDVEATLAGCYVDEDAGKRVCDFVGFLRYPEKGLGTVRLLDWQIYDVIVPLYGWKRSDGTRRYRNGCLWVPKKNGKSFICSFLALYHLIADGEHAPEVYVAAGDRDQAAIIYDESQHLAKASAQVAKRLKFVDSRKRMRVKEGRGLFRVLSSEATLAEGLKWSSVFLDELHVQRPAMFKTLRGGGVSRRQPLFLAISTAGEYDPNSIGWEQWEYSEKVQTGAVTDWSYFSVMYRLTKDEADGGGWRKPENWKKANPSYGEILNESFLEDLATQAETLTEQRSSFFRYHLNLWTYAAMPYIRIEDWQACEDAELTLDALEGRPGFGGLDLSLDDDLTAFAIWWPAYTGLPAALWVWYWLPEEVILEKAQENAAPYMRWVEQGLIETTVGRTINCEHIYQRITELCQKYHVKHIEFDRYNSRDVVQRLERDGIEMQGVAQGAVSMNDCVTMMRNNVRNGDVVFPVNELTRWQVSCCQLIHDNNGNVKLRKSEAGGRSASGLRRYKIDGVVAACMALNGALHTPVKQEPNVWVF